MDRLQLLTDDGRESCAVAPPALVLKLAPGERMVASLVYRRGGCTVKEVQARLPRTLTTATVRTILRRLERKGIVTRQPKGAYRTHVYLPAITNEYVRERALMRLAQEHFEGSLPSIAATLVHLMDGQLPPAAAENKGTQIFARTG
jgi:predicted transcriptional regulator